MRNNFSTWLAAVCLVFNYSVNAYEIEEKVVFSVDNPTANLQIFSTADRNLFAPIISAFQQENPTVAVTYLIAGSSDIMEAIVEEGEVFDLVVSSAMDLQTQLANDGFARSYQSSVTDRLPDWGRWRNSVFAFTQETAAIVVSAEEFSEGEIPTTREAILNAIREEPERFQGRIGTYDIRQSGLGYLFATQDSRTSNTYWRFIEVLGNFGVQLYASSSNMIDDVVSGKIAVAYNVLGSYADARTDVKDKIVIIEPGDYTTVMLRTALLMNNAAQAEEAEAFLDFLLSIAWRKPPPPSFLFPNKTEEEVDQSSNLRPIRLGPGLLVHLDKLKRSRFIKEWEASLIR